ncbi:MAG: hypothetical protein IPM85_17765 [Chitinophagaceae bacterium]|nr:hypothetical protein [Chitinophagaceae bacterium]
MQRVLFYFLLLIAAPAFSQLGNPYYDSTLKKWGYRLADGKIFVNPAYDLALPWNGSGLAAINIGRKETKVQGVTKIIPGKWGCCITSRASLSRPSLMPSFPTTTTSSGLTWVPK